MSKVPRYVDEKGQLAVLVSPGYGAGWSTWGQDNMELLCLHEDLVKILLDSPECSPERTKALEQALEDLGVDTYTGGESNLEIRWVKPGTMFRVEEYDGAESLVIFNEDHWMIHGE